MLACLFSCKLVANCRSHSEHLIRGVGRSPERASRGSVLVDVDDGEAEAEAVEVGSTCNVRESEFTEAEEGDVEGNKESESFEQPESLSREAKVLSV